MAALSGKLLTSREEEADLTQEGSILGTPAYMSPEQVRGQGSVDHRADLWALGCMTFECLTGRPVWNTDQGVAMTFAQIANAPIPRPEALRSDLPPEFTRWFDKALDRDITKRFQSAREFGEELAAVFHRDAPRSSFTSGGEGPHGTALTDADFLKASTPGRRVNPDTPTAAPPPPDPSRPVGPPAPVAAPQISHVPSGEFAVGPPRTCTMNGGSSPAGPATSGLAGG